MCSAEEIKERMLKSLRAPAHSDPLEAALHLGDDTERRAGIALEILSKSVDRSKLVRVQRTVSRNGKSYMTHMWVLPSGVQKGDIVIQNKAAYDKWAAENDEGTSLGTTKNRVNPMTKLRGKARANGGKDNPVAKSKSEPKPESAAKLEAKARSKQDTAPKQQPERKTNPRTITDGELKLYMAVLSKSELQERIRSHKIKLTKQQKAKVKEWAAEKTRMEARFAGSNLSDSYQKKLESRFQDATPDVRKAFDKYAVTVHGCIGDSNFPCTGKLKAHYEMYEDRIYFNEAKDSAGSRQRPGATFFHEIGHLIDYRSKHPWTSDGEKTVSHDETFLSAIRSDVEAVEQSMKQQMQKEGQRSPSIQQIRESVARELRQDGDAATSGIQDIFGGAIGQRYTMDTWGHKEDYWKCQKEWGPSTPERIERTLGTEAFANMYEACSNPLAAAAMEKWLPNAFRRFKEILAEIVKD